MPQGKQLTLGTFVEYACCGLSLCCFLGSQSLAESRTVEYCKDMGNLCLERTQDPVVEEVMHMLITKS